MLVNLRPHFSPLHRAQHQKKIKQIFKQKKKKEKKSHRRELVQLFIFYFTEGF